MYLTLSEIGKLYNISAIKTGKILYILGVRDPNHPIEKGFPFEQYIEHNIAHANLKKDGSVRCYTYNIETLKEEFQELIKPPKKTEKTSSNTIILRKISLLNKLITEVNNPELILRFKGHLSDIRYQVEQSDLNNSLPLDHKGELIYAKLVSFRKEESKRKEVSAFLIFTNAVIHQLAFYRPTSLDELSKIKGLGEKKLKDYAKTLLILLREINKDSKH